MKNIYKSILVAIVMIGGFSSCSDSDLAIDTLYDDVNTSGSVLRVVNYSRRYYWFARSDNFSNRFRFSCRSTTR